jgi:hypothetical protein
LVTVCHQPFDVRANPGIVNGDEARCKRHVVANNALPHIEDIHCTHLSTQRKVSITLVQRVFRPEPPQGGRVPPLGGGDAVIAAR